MPLSNKLLEAQALYYTNICLINRSIFATVHLEDYSDVLFWDSIIQQRHPGKYNYVYYYKNKVSETITKGCTLCLAYRPYLSKHFFVCIDSDLRYISKEKGISATDKVCQTYCYSWENHYLYAADLQERYVDKCDKPTFDFNIFLSKLSVLLFKPFMVISYNHRMNIPNYKDLSFPSSLPVQCNKKELEDNCKLLLSKIEQLCNTYMEMEEAKSVNLVEEEKYLKELKITEGNVYLHFRGHNLYDMIKNIGNYLVIDGISFENDIINNKIPDGGYWEYDNVLQDIDEIFNIE